MNLSNAIDGFCITIESDGYSPYTIEYYRSILTRWSKFLGNPNIEDIARDHIRQYLASLYKANLSSSSVYTHWKCIRSFYNFASMELHIERPDDIPPPEYTEREIIPFTQDEMKRLLKSCEFRQVHTSDGRSYTMKLDGAARDRAMMLVLLDTGMRVGEFIRLRYKSYDNKDGTIEVVPYRSGKKSRSRLLYVGKNTRIALWTHLSQRKDIQADDSLFATNTNSPLDRHRIGKILKRIGVAASVPHCHPHRFRHTFAIQFLRNGGDIFTLQRLLGHNSMAMVRRYLAIAQADVEDAHRRASPVDRWQL